MRYIFYFIKKNPMSLRISNFLILKNMNQLGTLVIAAFLVITCLAFTNNSNKINNIGITSTNLNCINAFEEIRDTVDLAIFTYTLSQVDLTQGFSIKNLILKGNLKIFFINHH